MNSGHSWCRKAFHRGVVQPFSRLALGVFLALTGQFSIPCYAGGSDDDKHLPVLQAKNVFAGLVVRIQKWNGARNVRILLDRVPLTTQGVPLCRKPTGRIFSVLSGKGFSRKAQPSAFVVMPEPSDPLPKNLSVGDCLTVDGNDVDRVDEASPGEEDRIQIVRALDGRKSKVRVVRGFLLHRWEETAFQNPHP